MTSPSELAMIGVVPRFFALPLALLALGAAALGVAAGHYRLEWLRVASFICFGSAFLSGSFLGFSALKTRRARSLAVAAFTLVSVIVAYAAAVVRYSDLTGPREVTSVVPSPDGRYELVVESYSVLIDPAYDVWLRETDGLFARRVRLWSSREGPVPTRVSFVGPAEVEVLDSSKNIRRSRFDSGTLEPSEFHCLGPWCGE